MNGVRYTALICLLAALTVEAFGTGTSGPSDDEPIRDRVLTAAEALFEARFPEYAPRLQLRVLRVNATVDDDVPLSLRLTAGDGVPRGRTQARVLADSPAGTHDAGWAMLFVAHYDSVGVAHRDIPSGEAVTPDDVGAAWLDVTTFRGRPLDAATLERIKAGEPFFTTQPIAAGDALRAGDVRPPYATDTGGTVTLTYRRGPILLTVSCRAREPGVSGDVIRLYSDATQSTYKARLTAPGKAEWVATL